jgi:hypothetical protein
MPCRLSFRFNATKPPERYSQLDAAPCHARGSTKAESCQHVRLHAKRTRGSRLGRWGARNSPNCGPTEIRVETHGSPSDAKYKVHAPYLAWPQVHSAATNKGPLGGGEVDSTRTGGWRTKRTWVGWDVTPPAIPSYPGAAGLSVVREKTTRDPATP